MNDEQNKETGAEVKDEAVKKNGEEKAETPVEGETPTAEVTPEAATEEIPPDTE